MLHERIVSLAANQRFEEAAEMRDRAQALLTALQRQRSIDALRRAEVLTVRLGDAHIAFEGGVLASVRDDDRLFSSFDAPLGLAEHLAAPERPEPDSPLPRHVADEVMCVARHLETADDVLIEECSGEWALSVRGLPTLRRLDLTASAPRPGRYSRSWSDRSAMLR
jgi:hypothetical protein